MIFKRVFISSRFFEFKDLRKRLSVHINNDKRFKVINLDDNRSDYRNPKNRSLEEVNSADIMILLIGDDYGDTRDENEYSYTHLEYKQAKEKGMKILAYFIGKTFNKQRGIKGVKVSPPQFQELIDDVLDNCTASIGDNIDHEVQSLKILNDLNGVNFSEKQYTNNYLTNDMSKMNNSNRIIERSVEIDICKTFLKNDKNVSSILLVTGNAGVGKTTFMINLFNNIEEDNTSNSFIFFIKERDSIEDIVESLYEYLVLKIKYIFNSYSINSFEIDDNLPINEKIKYLYKIYHDMFFEKYSMPFILLIDSIDGCSNEESLLQKIFYPTKGIHFCFSLRVNKLKQYIKKQHLEYEFLEIYGIVDESFTLKLENLDEDFSLKYIECFLNIRNFNNFKQNEMEKLKKLIYKKSEGLPLYLKYLIDDINKKDVINFDELSNELNQMPQSVNHYYEQVFTTMNNDEKNILLTLYWFNSFIDMSLLIKYSDDLTVPKLNELLKTSKLSSLVYINENYEVKLYHFSIYEGLFNFYSNYFGKVTSIKIDKELVKKTLLNENKIFGEIVHESSSLNSLSTVQYYSRHNVLFEKLSFIIQYNHTTENKSEQALNLFYQYTKIILLQENIAIDKLLSNNNKFSDVYGTLKISEKIKSHIFKFFTYCYKDNLNVSLLSKLFHLATLGNNVYYQSKIIYSFIQKSVEKTFIWNDNFDYEIYQNLNNFYIKDYIAKVFIINNKLPATLSLFNDGNNTILVHRNNKDIYSTIIDDRIKSYNKNKQRQLHDIAQRLIPFAENTTDIKVIETIKKKLIDRYRSLRQQEISNYKFKYSDLRGTKLELVINKLDFYISLFYINSDQLFTGYLYLSSEHKKNYHNISKILYKYNQSGIIGILNTDCLDYFIYLVRYIHEPNDLIKLWEYSKLELIEDKNKLIEIANILTIFCNDDSILKLIACFLESEKKDDKILKILSNIYYKQNNKEKLLSLLDLYKQNEFMKIERQFMINLVSNITVVDIENFNEFFNLYSLYVSNKNLIRKLFDNQLISDQKIIEFLLESIIKDNDDKLLVACVSSIAKYKSIELKKVVLDKYSKWIDNKTFFNLNILILEDLEQFFIEFNNLKDDEKYIYLSQNIHWIMKDKLEIYVDDRFWALILSLYESGLVDNKLLSIVYNRKELHDYCKKNRESLSHIFDKYNVMNIDTISNFNEYLYFINLVITEDQKRYFDIFNSNTKSLLTSQTIMMFVYNFTNIEDGIKFSEMIDDKLIQKKAKAYLHIKYYDEVSLDGALLDFYAMKDSAKVKQDIAAFMKYTIKDLIDDEKIFSLIDRFFVDYREQKCNLDKTFYFIFGFSEDIININNSLFYKFIQNKEQFFINYQKYFMTNTTDIVDNFFKVNEKSKWYYLESLLILRDIYKQSEANGDEVTYKRCEEVLELLIQNNVINDMDSLFNSNLSKLTLDNLFQHYNYGYDAFDLNIIFTNYNELYKYVSSLYELNKTIETEDISNQKFKALVDNIKKNEIYFNKIKECSHITNILQLKLANIDLFKPR